MSECYVEETISKKEIGDSFVGNIWSIEYLEISLKKDLSKKCYRILSRGCQYIFFTTQQCNGRRAVQIPSLFKKINKYPPIKERPDYEVQVQLFPQVVPSRSLLWSPNRRYQTNR